LSKIVKSGNVRLDGSNAYVIESGNFVPPTTAAYEEYAEEDSLNEEELTLAKARREAEIIIKTAQLNAERLMIDTREQCEAERIQTQKDAREQGYTQGYSKGLAESEAMKAEAEKSLNEANEYKKSVFESLEPQILELIINLTEKLLNDSVKIKPEVIINLIRRGLSETTVAGDIIIRVSAENYDSVASDIEKITEGLVSNAKVEIIKDNVLDSMDCVIETSFGNIDCSLDPQFEALKADLTALLD